MKNYIPLLTLALGILIGFGTARLMEKQAKPSTTAIATNSNATRSETSRATNSLSKAEFYEQWVQAIYTAKLNGTTAALSQLRQSKTNEAIAILEESLDVDLKKLVPYLQTIEKPPLDSLVPSIWQANDYRTEFPYQGSPPKP